MSVNIFGIRHHGPGSARSLLKALSSLNPDCILIEGPPEADEIIKLAGDLMKPPVAILVYLPEKPEKAVVYPFAVFSPEWQAIKFSLNNNIPVAFMDLPQYYQLSDKEKEEDINFKKDELEAKYDPITILAKISGYSDGKCGGIILLKIEVMIRIFFLQLMK